MADGPYQPAQTSRSYGPIGYGAPSHPRIQDGGYGQRARDWIQGQQEVIEVRFYRVSGQAGGNSIGLPYWHAYLTYTDSAGNVWIISSLRKNSRFMAKSSAIPCTEWNRTENGPESNSPNQRSKTVFPQTVRGGSDQGYERVTHTFARPKSLTCLRRAMSNVRPNKFVEIASCEHGTKRVQIVREARTWRVWRGSWRPTRPITSRSAAIAADARFSAMRIVFSSRRNGARKPRSNAGAMPNHVHLILTPRSEGALRAAIAPLIASGLARPLAMA